ncbi:PHD and ring finger domains 1 [Seminavis robusta]|uniref:PHD and ring finger domains 1 n=1 Tax=Seminavis robusta TaxID=568900 RepID=A0A9N8DF05_9STRA|nr:PHD and ring finger domains 1 [Seminavis robusta]|eukprot:Sro58_g033640.1 PHD and ring finger domains 1 (1224) ;mRNA; f:28334-32167
MEDDATTKKDSETVVYEKEAADEEKQEVVKEEAAETAEKTATDDATINPTKDEPLAEEDKDGATDNAPGDTLKAESKEMEEVKESGEYVAIDVTANEEGYGSEGISSEVDLVKEDEDFKDTPEPATHAADTEAMDVEPQDSKEETSTNEKTAENDQKAEDEGYIEVDLSAATERETEEQEDEATKQTEEETNALRTPRRDRTSISAPIAGTRNDDDDDIMTVPSSEGQDDAGDDDDDDSKSSPIPSHLPDYLDKSTVKSIRSYLNDFDPTTALDEDDICNLMIKTDRNVEYRARYYSNPLDDLMDEDQMYKEFHKEEEEYLVGHDFVKAMSKSLYASRNRGLDKRTLNWVKRAAGLKRPDYHSPHSALGRDDEDSDDNDGKRKAPRRYTRGMARTTRIKKKEEFAFMDNLGLKSLLDAVEEMEPTAGPYPVPFECIQSRERKVMPQDRKRSGSRSYSRRDSLSRRRDPPSDDDSAKLKSTFDPVTMRPLVARISEEDSMAGLARCGDDYIFGETRDLLVTKVLVDGEHVSEDEGERLSLKERKRELKRLRDRQYQKKRRERQLAEKERRKSSILNTPVRSNRKRGRDDDSGSDDDGGRRKIRPVRPGKRKGFSRKLAGSRPLRGPVSLPLLDWQRRQMWSTRTKPKREEADANNTMDIPDQLAKWGITHRPPPWDAVNPALGYEAEYEEPLRRRHADDVYGLWCHKLINCLNGSARAWAIHEFFYSDLDRPWYSSNTFAKEVAKLGISPTAKLTRREWSLVRRMIRKRPLRFSRKFVLSQLKERNEFRNQIRHLQRNPDADNNTGYDIPAPIRVGATVTAYNKRFLVLHRGTVLFHDVHTARYLIQFERPELGCQFCSDTEVASHGVPRVLTPAVPRHLCGSYYKAKAGNFVETGAMPYGTSYASLPVANDVTCDIEMANLMTMSHQREFGGIVRKPEDARTALVEKVAERETLVSLLSIIEAATGRKERLLKCMDKFNCLLVERLPFGGGAPPNHIISEYYHSHYAWLEANLQSTNHSLDRAHSYLKVMYSGAYSATSGDVKAVKDDVMKRFVESCLAEEKRFGGGPPAETVHWIAALHHGSHDVGSYLASLVVREEPQSGSQRTTSSTSGETNPQSAGHILRRQIAAAGSVLSTIGYCCGRSAESDITMQNGDVPFVDVVLASGLSNRQSEVPNSERNGVVKDMLDERTAAEQDLKDSLALLRKEFTGLSYAAGGQRSLLG